MTNLIRDERTLVVRLREQIRAMIERDGLKPGDRLPSESELTRTFHISRPALREALKLLEEDGIIYVEHGKGRFVSAMAAVRVERPITVFESVTDMVRRFGYQPKSKVLSFAEEPAGQEVGAALKLPPEARVIKLERLRMQGDDVILYCLDYVPRSLVAERLYEVDWTGSLLDILERNGHRPRMSAATASSVMLPKEVVERNDLANFGPALLITEVGFSPAGAPVVYAKDYHRGSAFTFSFVRK